MSDFKLPIDGCCEMIDLLLPWMHAGQDRDWSRGRADFYRFFSAHDRRRGTDFRATFPEMGQWWEECRRHAQRI